MTKQEIKRNIETTVFYEYDLYFEKNKYLVENNDRGLLVVYEFNDDIEYSNDLKTIINMKESFIRACIIFELLTKNGIVKYIAGTTNHRNGPREYCEWGEYLVDVGSCLDSLRDDDKPYTLDEISKDEDENVRNTLKNLYPEFWN